MTHPQDNPSTSDPQQPAYPPPADPFVSGPNPLPEDATAQTAPVSPAQDPAAPVSPAATPVYQPGQATPGYATTDPTAAYPTQQYGGPQVGPDGAEPAKPKRRGLVIAATALGVLLLLCAGGSIAGFFLFNNDEGQGADTAKAAAADFLTAVYKDGNTDAANALTCGAARDPEALQTKIDEIEAGNEGLSDPKFRWDDPEISDETAEAATATVTVVKTTKDEKQATQDLTLTLVKHEGWFVCEVHSAPTEG